MDWSDGIWALVTLALLIEHFIMAKRLGMARAGADLARRREADERARRMKAEARARSVGGGHGAGPTIIKLSH